MCAAYTFRGRIFRPGRVVPAVGAVGVQMLPWAGFARSEILDWWLRKGCEAVDLPAARFAERSRSTGRLIWEEVPPELVIRGLSGEGVVRVVTRAADSGEMERFDHPRMPLLEQPRHPRTEVDLPPEEPNLFGWQE